MATCGVRLVVAALDFETTYSGRAFSFKHEFETNPCKVSGKNWMGNKLISLKGPTCVLIRPDGKTMHAFGFDAETQYSQLSQTGEHTTWYYFHRFKMMLWHKPIHKETMLEDETGKSLRALTVFSLSIRYMVDDMTAMSKQQVNGLKPEDIHYVLKVLAIWNDAAKQFMRLAAEEAVISSKQLTLALEPDAASIYCRYIPVQVDEVTRFAGIQPGNKYLVLDAGGGTIDIILHEACFGAKLKELYKATGGARYGTMVDAAFLDFVANLIGKDTLERFNEKHTEDFIDLLRDFELKKRATDSKSETRVTMKLPLALIELVNNKGCSLQQIVQTSQYAKQATLSGDKLRIAASIFRSFFKQPIDEIVRHVKELLRKEEAAGVEAILMVGGYFESPILNETLQKEFSTLKIIVPPESGLAILKGAVIFGHCPNSITQRVSKFIYGLKVCKPFVNGSDPIEKLIKTDSGDLCEDYFHILVQSGELLNSDDKQFEDTSPVSFIDQKSVTIDIYILQQTKMSNTSQTTDVNR